MPQVQAALWPGADRLASRCSPWAPPGDNSHPSVPPPCRLLHIIWKLGLVDNSCGHLFQLLEPSFFQLCFVVFFPSCWGKERCGLPMSCTTAADGCSGGWSSFTSELLGGDLLPSCCQFVSLESWLASLKCCDINLFFWIQCCRLRLIPCPLALVLFVLLCWMSSICGCFLSYHPGSVANSYNKYSSATWTLPFALILCSYLTAR